MNCKATLETRVSQKGNEYQVLVFKLTDTYEKLVFLDKAEIELLKANSKSEVNSKSELKFPDMF